jgi:hypothetical protein
MIMRPLVTRFTAANIVAIVLSAISATVMAALFLEHENYYYFPMFNQVLKDFSLSQLLTFSVVLVSTAVGSAGLGLIFHQNKKGPDSGSVVIPKRNGVEYPFEILRLPHQGVIWPVFAEDRHPIAGEPLLVFGSKCPKCNGKLEESRKSSGQYRWKCVACRFVTLRGDSMETISKRVQELANDKLNAG